MDNITTVYYVQARIYNMFKLFMHTTPNNNKIILVA